MLNRKFLLTMAFIRHKTDLWIILDDVESDGLREPICNYKWADDIDVINVLHGVSDWPVALQVNNN